MNKSIAVLGLGKYGRSLASNLYRLGADVLAVDCDENIVAEYTSRSTSSICANLSNEDEVLSLGLESMDIVVTSMGSNLTASIMAVSVAKEKGVPTVIAKSTSDRMTAILLKVGADKIIDPEDESGARSAHILMSSYLKDCYKIDDNLSMVEMIPKDEWVGKSLAELDLRKAKNLNVVAVREGKESWRVANPRSPIKKDCLLLVLMERNTLYKLK